MDERCALRRHLEIEVPLADRLRMAATVTERRQLYASVYAQYHTAIAADLTINRRDSRTDRVPSQVRLLRPLLRPETTFVEVGAGDGAVAAAIAPNVTRSIALDVSDALAQTVDIPQFEFRVFDGFNLGVEPGTVDLAFSNDVVEHLHPDDARDHAHAIQDALKPGGRYLCVTPNRLWGPHDVSRSFSETPLGFHLREYTASELGDLLLNAGFSSVQVFLSWQGRHLTPLMPLAAVRPLEHMFARLPRTARLRLGVLLAAIKVVATR